MTKPSESKVVAALMKRHGRTFSSELGININSAAPSALFCWLCSSLLYSARISNEIATKAARALTKSGWTTAQKMAAAAWEERTRVLNQAGYARYDEKTSRMLADTSNLLKFYNGDLSKLREAEECDPARERKLLMECKGIAGCPRIPKRSWPRHGEADESSANTAGRGLRETSFRSLWSSIFVHRSAFSGAAKNLGTRPYPQTRTRFFGRLNDLVSRVCLAPCLSLSRSSSPLPIA